MEKALGELAQIGDRHHRVAAEQRDSLAEIRRRSIELLRRGASAESIANAIGISTVAVHGWDAAQRP